MEGLGIIKEVLSLTSMADKLESFKLLLENYDNSITNDSIDSLLSLGDDVAGDDI